MYTFYSEYKHVYKYTYYYYIIITYIWSYNIVYTYHILSNTFQTPSGRISVSLWRSCCFDTALPVFELRLQIWTGREMWDSRWSEGTCCMLEFSSPTEWMPSLCTRPIPGTFNSRCTKKLSESSKSSEEHGLLLSEFLGAVRKCCCHRENCSGLAAPEFSRWPNHMYFQTSGHDDYFLWLGPQNMKVRRQKWTKSQPWTKPASSISNMGMVSS